MHTHKTYYDTQNGEFYCDGLSVHVKKIKNKHFTL